MQKSFIVLGFSLGLIACAGSSTNVQEKRETTLERSTPNFENTSVFTIVFENHEYKDITKPKKAPFFNELIAKYGLATNYWNCGVRPSNPNYLCMTSGLTFYQGLFDKDPTDEFDHGRFPADVKNIASQLMEANIPWRSYQESMALPCRIDEYGNYAPKHNPFLYYKDVQQGANGVCAKTNVDYSFFERDLAENKVRYYFITPNMKSDGHDPILSDDKSLKTSDAWARAEVTKIMASDAYKKGGIIFITWDEGTGLGTESHDHVPMIIVSERLKNAAYRSNQRYSHKSYLATVEDIFGLPRLATVSSEPSMTEFFN